MKFDFFELCNYNNESLLRCIRAYTIIPKYTKNPTEKNYKAEKIISTLQKIKTKLNKKFGFCWQKKWLNSLPIKVQKNSTKDWFSGRASIPLIALFKLKTFGCEKEVNFIKNNLDYFSSKTGNIARIPKKISPELAWITAVILCDGHLAKNEFKVSLQVTDKLLVKKFANTFCEIFELQQNNIFARPSHHGNKILYRFDVSCKPVIYFLNFFLEIPRSKKSEIIRIPKIISESPIKIKRSFLKGVFDTDRGKRGHGLGLTSASKEFVDQTYVLLQEFNIKPYKDSWINKKYNKQAFGLKFKNDSNSNFLNKDN
jgi:hypothetical protein